MTERDKQLAQEKKAIVDLLYDLYACRNVKDGEDKSVDELRASTALRVTGGDTPLDRVLGRRVGDLGKVVSVSHPKEG